MPAMTMKRRTMLGAAAALAFAGPAGAAVPAVRLLPGTPLLPLGPFDPAAAHYVVEEYAVSGTATSYKELGSPDAQGNWRVAPAGSAPYAIRIVVIRPADAAKCNGAVMAEWLNVTWGTDYGALWHMARRELVRGGFAYVGVSAQSIGIEGGTTVFGMPAKGLKQLDAQRYGSLHHPGDAYSYDIFSQVAALLKCQGSGGVLGALAPAQVLGAGESQSAAYLTTYANAVDPVAKCYDGFLIGSRFRSSAALDGSGMGVHKGAPAVKMAAALRVPTLIVETETDVVVFGYHDARQPDTARLRVWEIAGTAHADAYLLKVAAVDSGTASAAALAAAYAPSDMAFGAKLAEPYNNGPQSHYVMEAAIAQLARWVATGAAAPHGRPLALAAAHQPHLPVLPVLDGNGNAVGGVRSPWVDVPTSRLAGYGNSGGPAAMLVGAAEPFSAARLAHLYPGGKAEYLQRFEVPLGAAIDAGFILPADRDEIIGIAAISYGKYG